MLKAPAGNAPPAGAADEGDSLHNPIQTLSLLYYSAFRSLRAWRSWRPLLGFWLLQGALLVALSRFTELPGSEAIGRFLASWLDPEVGEYPRLYLWLPDIHRRLYLILAATVGILFQGVCIIRLAERYGRGQLTLPRAWSRAFVRWPGLFLINIMGLALILLPLYASHRWLMPLAPTPEIGSVIRAGTLAVGIGFDAFIVYAAYLYLVYRNGLGQVLLASFSFARQRFPVSFGIVMIPFLLALPIRMLIGTPRAIMETFRPEIVLYLLLLSSFVTMLLLFLQLATIIRFHISEVNRNAYGDY